MFLTNARRGDSSLDISGDTPNPRMFADGLAAAGVVVTCRRLNRFPLNPLAHRGTFYAGFDVLRALRVLLFDRRFDVIVSVGESNIAVILLLARLLRFKPRIVMREIAARGWRMRDRIVDFVLPRVDRISVLTPHQKDWADSAYRLRSPADLVGFATDETFFTPQGRPDGEYVLAVGDDAGRDYPCLIAACRDLSWNLVLRTGTKPEIPRDMQGRVTMMGRLSFEGLRDLYAAANVVVVPLCNVDHPSGITALFEAMAMGRTVVASNVGSTRHIIKDGINGRLVEVGNVAAMRAAITALMHDNAGRKQLGEAARRTIEEQFSYASFVQRYAAWLQRAAAGI